MEEPCNNRNNVVKLNYSLFSFIFTQVSKHIFISVQNLRQPITPNYVLKSEDRSDKYPVVMHRTTKYAYSIDYLIKTIINIIIFQAFAMFSSIQNQNNMFMSALEQSFYRLYRALYNFVYYYYYYYYYYYNLILRPDLYAYKVSNIDIQ